MTIRRIVISFYVMLTLLFSANVYAQFTLKDLGYDLSKNHSQDNFKSWETLPLDGSNSNFPVQLSYRIKNCSVFRNKSMGEFFHPLGKLQVKVDNLNGYKDKMNMVSGRVVITAINLYPRNKNGFSNAEPAQVTEELKFSIIVDMNHSDIAEEDIPCFYKMKSIEFIPDVVEDEIMNKGSSKVNDKAGASKEGDNDNTKTSACEHSLEFDDWSEWKKINDSDYEIGFKYSLYYRTKKCNRKCTDASKSINTNFKHSINVIEIKADDKSPFDNDYGYVTGVFNLGGSGGIGGKYSFILKKGEVSTFKMNTYDISIDKVVIQLPPAECIRLKKENGIQTFSSSNTLNFCSRINNNNYSFLDETYKKEKQYWKVFGNKELYSEKPSERKNYFFEYKPAGGMGVRG